MPHFAAVHSVGLIGVSGHVVEVEAHISSGLPGFVITGLPDTAVAEARERVRAAVLSSGAPWPSSRITVGLSPAWLPKHGSAFDLAVALAILVASQAIPMTPLTRVVCLGELGLDGRLRAVRGVLPALLAAAHGGFTTAIVPQAQLAEGRLVSDMAVYGAHTLRTVVGALRSGLLPTEALGIDEIPSEPESPAVTASTLCLSDVVGQQLGRFAVEVAAAGGHHLALFGPPGAGKTMLAERLPGVLPPLDETAALEVTAIHSVANRTSAIQRLITDPPYQAPHHTATPAALVGGGAGLAQPGAMSLAHRGVLFLDEATEFPARVLDALREPLERGEVVLARAHGVTRYPSQTQLVLAANPCPCGAGLAIDCQCSPALRRRYLGRLSGPLLDRVDIQVELMPVTPAALCVDGGAAESTPVVAARVQRARQAAADRWRSHGWLMNAAVPGHVLRGAFRPPREVTALADRALERGQLSARGYDRVLRLAWTLSDLDGRGQPSADDVAEALGLRLRQSYRGMN